MITTRLDDGSDNFSRDLIEKRKRFANGHDWDREKTYLAKIRSSGIEFYNNDHFLNYLTNQLFNYEKDMIYQAVVFSNGEWTAVRSSFLATNSFEFCFNDYEVMVKVEAVVSDRKIYVPIYEASQMPKDVYSCSWCGGYTKNDKRGHCAGCGGPRNDRAFENAGRY